RPSRRTLDARRDFGGTARFRILERLGTGRVGVVYAALDRERDAVVALKTLRNLGDDRLPGFKREFFALKNLAHPNLVRLGELVEENNLWFFTMELICGFPIVHYARPSCESGRPTLAGELAPGVPSALVGQTGTERPEQDVEVWEERYTFGYRLDEGRLRLAFRQLADGLVALHAAGKIHRNIRPSNVLVEPSTGRLTILDSGVFVDADSLAFDPTASDPIGSSTMYLSPEQATGADVGPASDWYAAGVMLYMALAGQPPFVGSAEVVLQLKQHADPVRPSQLGSAGADDLEALCMDLLSRDPARRPTGSEVLARLRG